MAHILVVTGSVRPHSVNQKVVPVVIQQLTEKGAEVTVADLAELALPFFDAPFPPTAPEFAPEHASVQQWTDMVSQADGIVFVTPEYNHTMSPVQLNAVDWIGKEWENKPIALVGYGWSTGGSQAHDTAREALGANLKARVGATPTNLFFMKDLNPDGSLLDADSVQQKISATLDELLQAV
ncbi:MAG TPA: NAD(P)H-dependent oxidoreductase [Candidatus Saccharibacteria bacterium]|nr:NAD(P)H-dependent oxidoreductase [Candidatus Saccharibacteria bacterium]HMR38006.1 NAD(P)H-dependent oxidoreductase [Candidatus Saccharibacteria bacterium]